MKRAVNTTKMCIIHIYKTYVYILFKSMLYKMFLLLIIINVKNTFNFNKHTNKNVIFFTTYIYIKYLQYIHQYIYIAIQFIYIYTHKNTHLRRINCCKLSL